MKTHVTERIVEIRLATIAEISLATGLPVKVSTQTEQLLPAGDLYTSTMLATRAGGPPPLEQRYTVVLASEMIMMMMIDIGVK